MGATSVYEDNRALQAEYDVTACIYNILNYPCEQKYRTWHPRLQEDVRGDVLEAGAGGGRTASPAERERQSPS